jgi:putative ABC transport system permease protein
MVVLTCAGLTVASMVRLLRVKPGFDAENVLAMDVVSPQINLYNGPPVRPRFCIDVAGQVGTLPGVVAVSSVAQLPLRGGAGRSFAIEGRQNATGERSPGGSYDVTCPGYFRTMRIPVREGREFGDRDTLNSLPVAMINQAMARQYWPNENPIGQRIQIAPVHADTPWLTIVGIAGDVHKMGLDQEPDPELYRPYTQAAWPQMTVVVRTAGSPLSLAQAVRKALAKMDPDRAASDPMSLAEVIDGSVGDRRFVMMILGSLAALALALSAVGIGGVISYSVAQRSSEIGIRMALGASRGGVVWLVVVRGLQWSIAGVGVGILLSLAAGRLLEGMLFSVKPSDPLILAAVAGLLILVSTMANYLPARRAAQVDPMTALRYV